MRILSPLLNFNEVEPLCDAGADDFYCGLVDEKAPINERPLNWRFCFKSLGELRKSVQAIHRRGKRVFLAINSPRPSLKRSVDQALIAREIGMDGVILANLFLIKKIRDLKLGLELQASCLIATFNSETMMFLKGMGVTHIHLLGQMSVWEIKKLFQNTEGVKFSVFVLDMRCRFIPSICCGALHGVHKEPSTGCIFRTLGVIADKKEALGVFDKKLNRPQVSCGLCAIRSLNQAGVHSLKIAGRSNSLETKYSQIVMVKEGIHLINKSICESDLIRRCKGIFEKGQGYPCVSEFCRF
ncbi:MAG: U32 family peptidase [Candidatus Omnitrophica bacterium]|nr:U32 family peptidase [Candidatus Omnitrophota bacterium]